MASPPCCEGTPLPTAETQAMKNQQETIEKTAHEAGPETDHQPPRTQEELRQAYLEQQRRLHCPSCGESDQVF